MKKYIRPFVQKLKKSVTQRPDLIHVVLGPRQVGKTTGVLQLLDQLPKSKIKYVSADGEISRSPAWLYQQWVEAVTNNLSLLVVDEIQKVENWPETIKQVWDEQQRKSDAKKLKLILLGSSSLNIQKGLSESLTGRYLRHQVNHWNFEESNKAFGLTLDEFLQFGGYPKSYEFRHNPIEWIHYVRGSIIEPVIGKDILSSNKVKSPALFKQCFDLVCSYAAQEISYTKLLGQLQDKGNTDLVRFYLELFEGAFLIKILSKFSGKKVLSRSSSPKILPLCPALYSNTLDGLLYRYASDGSLDFSPKGRAFELMIGAELQALPGELYYWREKNMEVDYVLQFKGKIWAIEVKSGEKKNTMGMIKFKEKFPSCETLLITPDNFQNVLKKLRSKEIGF